MNPCLPRPIEAGSQPVCGTAPMNTTSAAAGTVSTLPVFVSLTARASGLPVPSAAAVWALAWDIVDPPSGPVPESW
jgi:hypothetical protein